MNTTYSLSLLPGFVRSSSYLLLKWIMSFLSYNFLDYSFIGSVQLKGFLSDKRKGEFEK
jgi:hypothetical protein